MVFLEDALGSATLVLKRTGNNVHVTTRQTYCTLRVGKGDSKGINRERQGTCRFPDEVHHLTVSTASQIGLSFLDSTEIYPVSNLNKLMCSFLGVFSSVQFLLNDILASLFCMSETFYVS